MQMTPGRIAALAAGVPLALALIGWTGYDFVGLVGQGTMQISGPITIGGGGLTANITGTDILLRQVPGNTAELTGTAQYSLFRPVLTESQTGAGTSISFRCRGLTGNCGLNATLQVPSRTGVTLSTGGSNVSVPAFNGSLELLTGGGDVTAGSVAGTVRVQTDGGNVGANSLSGSLNLQTSGGDLNADTVSGDITLTAGTDGGNVDVQAMADPNADITSSGGDVTLTFTQVPRNLQISTDGGNILVVLPAGSAAYDLQASTGGGNLSVSRSVPTDSRSKNSLVLESNGGNITVAEG